MSPGERILVHGAGGGVGSALLQLAKLVNLDTFGTGTGSALDFIAANSATPIDYRNDDFLRRVRALTGDGVDVVFDLIGGPRQLWRSYRCLRRGGRLMMLGMSGTSRAGTRIIVPSLLVVGALSLWPDGKSVPTSPNMQTHPRANLAWYRETLTDFFAMTMDGRLDPAVHTRIPLHEAARAHALLKHGGHPAKIVLTGRRYQGG